MNPQEIVNQAISPYPNNCAGYMTPGSYSMGYISTLKLSLGKVRADMDVVLNSIVAYDRAAKNDAYFGQVNVLTATSFSGVIGQIWGYDLAIADSIYNKTIEPIKIYHQFNGKPLPVFSMDPLLDATMRLFGTEEQLRFPLLPGTMCISAQKAAVTDGSASPIYGSLAIAIAEDRSTCSSLFIEDCNTLKVNEGELFSKIVESILLVGQNQNVVYKEVFIGFKSMDVDDGFVGSAKACGPYILLAPHAIPKDLQPSDLLNMSITQWEEALNLPPLIIR